MNPSAGQRRIAFRAAVAATAVALWGALVLLFSAPLALTGPLTWRQALGFGVNFWAPWLLLLPAVAWLAFRFPIERRHLVRNLALHGAICLLGVVVNRTTFRYATQTLPRPERTDAPGAPALPGPLASAAPPGAAPIPRGYRLGPPGTMTAFFGMRAALDGLVYWSLVGACQAITNFRSSQARERRAAELEARLTRAKLQALRMQIHPHFLFNTLNSIAALVYVNPRAADEMLGDLSDLLRRSLDSMEEQEIPLARELEFIGVYTSIEQKRFGDRLQVEIRVPEDLRDALVPALLLQPLVENSIRHGIEPRRGPGLIAIEARQRGNRLHLVVQDNGRGLQEPADSVSEGHGIGLSNIRARLQGLYGTDHSLAVKVAEPQGCRVEVDLPLRNPAANRPAPIRKPVS